MYSNSFFTVAYRLCRTDVPLQADYLDWKRKVHSWDKCWGWNR